MFVKRASGRAGARDLEREAAILGVLAEVPGVGRLAARALAQADGGLASRSCRATTSGARRTAAASYERATRGRRRHARSECSTGRRIGSPPASCARRGHVGRLLGAAGGTGLPSAAERCGHRSAPGAPGRRGPLRSSGPEGADEAARRTFVHGDPEVRERDGGRYSVLDAGRHPLVDWEFAGRGDARDDVGAFVGGLPRRVAGSTPPHAGSSPLTLVGRAAWPLEAARGADRRLPGGLLPARAASTDADALRLSALRLRRGATGPPRFRGRGGDGGHVHGSRAAPAGGCEHPR